MEKRCSACKIIKPSEEFCKRQPRCKPCHSQYTKEYRGKNKEKIQNYTKSEKYKLSLKKYRDNNKEKQKLKNIKYNSDPNNQEKIKEYRKQYYSLPENEKKRKLNYLKLSQDHKWKENKSKYNKEWNEANKHKIKEYNKLWNEINKDYVKEYNSRIENKEKTNNRAKNKYKNDPYHKLVSILRIRFYQVITNKSESTLKFLSCSINDLKLYLESLFLPEMTWENHGEIWEIDHILPCASFNLKDIEEQKKCFHYTNLQPLFKTTKIAESFGYTDQIGNRNKKDKIL